MFFAAAVVFTIDIPSDETRHLFLKHSGLHYSHWYHTETSFCQRLWTLAQGFLTSGFKRNLGNVSPHPPPKKNEIIRHALLYNKSKSQMHQVCFDLVLFNDSFYLKNFAYSQICTKL